MEARFVKESMSSGRRQSYSTRFFDSKRDLSMRANFANLYYTNGNVMKEKVANSTKYTKYGRKGYFHLGSDSSDSDLYNCLT